MFVIETVSGSVGRLSHTFMFGSSSVIIRLFFATNRFRASLFSLIDPRQNAFSRLPYLEVFKDRTSPKFEEARKRGGRGETSAREREKRRE